MQRRSGSWNDVRSKGFFVAVLIAFCGALFGHALYDVMTAKTPGDTHCYGDVCHRVFTLDETRRMIGQTVDIVATHYDAPGVDKFNVGQYTSSGEEFDAESAARASASNYPDGTELLIWHPGTRRAAHVRVNDFGPFKGNRTLDVTRKVADVMNWAKNGVATLKVTVVWVPPNDDPRYKKGRVYPASFGLIGIVEPHQYAVLADRLIATGPARNGQRPGSADPNIAMVLALPRPAPSFRSEGVTEATWRQREEALAMARALQQAPPIVLAGVPQIDPLFVDPPAFRSEAIADASRVARPVEIALAQLPQPPTPYALPAELQPPAPIIVALAPVIPSSAEPQAGTAEANRSKVELNTGEQTVAAVQAQPEVTVSGSESVERSVAGVAVPPSASTEPTVTVASAQLPIVSRLDVLGSPALWIGVGLMLSALWGASALRRSRQSQSAVVAARAPAYVQPTPSADHLAIARLAAEKAEARARAVAEAAGQSSSVSESEILAREDLARELALRDYEREQEATMRARAEAAAAAHDAARRDLAALEAFRAARVARDREHDRLAGVRAPSAPATVGPAPVAQAPLAQAPKPLQQPTPPRALANDAEMARFHGIKDRALVGGILGLPGATKFWGNTIIAQMHLDGSARSGSPMRVDGSIDGACTAPILLISEGAVVSGVIAAETIVVLGKVTGILSGKHVFVASSAEIEGEVYYQTISIDPQAHCDVSFRRLPSDTDPIELGTTVYAARAA
jgi:cytoskeletal protein CcmA (bactofilin family)